MRSVGEVMYRLRQEAANLWLYRRPPEFAGSLEAPLPGLPCPDVIAEALRGSAFHKEVEAIADSVLAHRLPILDSALDAGPEIRWRRDYVNGIESDNRYFRRVPYMNFARVGDYRVIWEMNRHQYLVAVAQAFLFTGRREYIAEIESQLTTWIAENPFQCGLNWTSALEVAFRALSWIWIYHLAGTQMTEAFRRRFLITLDRHGHHIGRNLSVHFSPNTHLLGEAVALHALGRLCPAFPRARQWREMGRDIAVQQAKSQVRDDGSHFEQSTYYHVYALDLFLLHAAIEETSDSYRGAVLRMAEYLAAIMGPSRTLPLIGDDDGGRVFHPFGPRDRFGRATLATCGLLFDRPEWIVDRSDLHQQAVWWLSRADGVAIAGESACATNLDQQFAKQGGAGIQPAEFLPRAASHGSGTNTSTLFPQSGIVVMQAGPMHLVMDAGSFGSGSGGHSHSDTLSLVVRVGDEEILIDPGAYTYSDPLWRNRFRSSAAHNTIRVNRRDQSLPTGHFRWASKPHAEMREWVTTTRYDYADGVCRYGDIVLRRRVWFDKSGLVLILDEVQGPDGEHEIEQFWHTGAATALDGSAFRIGDRARLILPDAGLAELSEGGDYGWRSTVFASKRPTPLIRVHRKTHLPVQLGAALDLAGDCASDLRLARIDEKTIFRYCSGGTQKRVTFAETGVPELVYDAPHAVLQPFDRTKSQDV